MKPTKAFYSLIQYCPDRGRAEVANVGVLVFCPHPQFIAARASTNNKHAVSVFGHNNVDTVWLKQAKESFEIAIRAESQRFRALEDLERFISTRGNELVVTAPRVMRTTDAKADLDLLYSEYVDDEPAKARQPLSALVRTLDSTFISLEQRGKSVRIGHKFEVPEFHRTVRADYAYNNGCTNIVRLLYTDQPEGSVFQHAVSLGGESIFVTSHLKVEEREAKVIVVADPRTSDSTSALERRLKRLFKNTFNTKMILSNKISEFAKKVEEEAH